MPGTRDQFENLTNSFVSQKFLENSFTTYYISLQKTYKPTNQPTN